MASVGVILREAREKKKLTLDDAARATKIKKELIQALEGDEYEKVPAPTYARGFLKIYASYLGLDPKEVVREYLKDHAGGSEQVLVLDVEGQVKQERSRWVIPYVVIGVAVVIIVTLVISFAVKGIRSLKKPPALPSQMEVLEPSSVTIEKAEILEPLAPESPREMELRLKATKKVWVRVKQDGSTVFQNVIEKGDEEFWKGTSGFGMRVGRPDAVILTLNGKPIAVTGKNIKVDEEGNVEISD